MRSQNGTGARPLDCLGALPNQEKIMSDPLDSLNDSDEPGSPERQEIERKKQEERDQQNPGNR